MVKKPEKVGGQKMATGGLCRHCRGLGERSPQPPEARGVGVESPVSENFCIFYIKKVIFSAFNCIICCNNVLCTMCYTNTKCSDM